jgi:hypothetical protein
LQRRRERLDVVGGDEHAGIRRYRLWNGAGGRADDRHAMGNGLGIGHAVAFEPRGQHEEIGRCVERRKLVGPDRAEERNLVGKTQTRDVGPDLPGRLRAAPAIAHDREAPGQMRQSGERRDQHIVALARDQRADGEQFDDTVLIARPRWDAIRSRLYHAHPFGRNAVVVDEQPRDPSARRHHVARTGEGHALARTQGGRFGRAQPRLERERMMHQRDQRVARTQPVGGIRERAEGETVDHERTPMGERR